MNYTYEIYHFFQSLLSDKWPYSQTKGVFMNKNIKAFSSFSVDDLDKAKKFYGDTLGLKISEESRAGCGSMLTLSLEGGGEVLIYPKKDHVPATFTVLNFVVKDIEKTVKEISAKGVSFEHYEGSDELGIMHDEGPVVAWFKDPAGNFISYMEAEEAVTQDEFKLNHFIPKTKEEVFEYWTRPDLIEQWACPDGMTLKIPKLEAKKGGKYIFEHQAKEGLYLCHGHFSEFIPNEKVVQVDTVQGPDGKLLFSDLECVVEFNSTLTGTEILLTQRGFQDQNSLNECKESWNQCFKKLDDLINNKSFIGTAGEKMSDVRTES